MPGDFEGIFELGGAAAVELAASALAERGAKTSKCANCDAPLIGAYCAVCGQEHDTHRRSVSVLLRDFVKDVANLDSRILRTTIALLFRPGELSCAFRGGRTRRYVPAVRLYLFVSLVFFLVLSFTRIGIVQLGVVINGQVKVDRSADNNYIIKLDPATKIDQKTIEEARKAGIELQPGKFDGTGEPIVSARVRFFAPLGSVQARLPPSVRTALAHIRAKIADDPNTPGRAFTDKIIQGVQHVSENPAALNGPLTTWIPRVFFLLVPLFALVLALFNIRRRRQFFFVDHLVFSLNIFSFAFVAMLFAAGAAQLLPGNLVAWATLLALALYLIFSMKGFYEQTWLMTATKFLAVSFVYAVFILAPAVVAVLLASISEA